MNPTTTKRYTQSDVRKLIAYGLVNDDHIGDPNAAFSFASAVDMLWNPTCGTLCEDDLRCAFSFVAKAFAQLAADAEVRFEQEGGWPAIVATTEEF